jgi:hypothetical protein
MTHPVPETIDEEMDRLVEEFDKRKKKQQPPQAVDRNTGLTGFGERFTGRKPRQRPRRRPCSNRREV